MSLETTTYCARHPKEETAVSCASCGTPICTRCMVSTPVGMKCRDCASNKNSVLYKVRPERLLLAAITALIAGVGAALMANIGFFVIFLGTAYGYFAGSVILKASGMKRGMKLEIIAGAGIVIGAIGFRLLPLLVASRLGNTSFVPYAAGLLASPYFWIAVAISAGCAVSKIRYL